MSRSYVSFLLICSFHNSNDLNVRYSYGFFSGGRFFDKHDRSLKKVKLGARNPFPVSKLKQMMFEMTDINFLIKYVLVLD